MKRGLYFLAGTAAGAYATTRLRRAAESLTVDGVHDRLTGWFAGARVLGAEARTAMAQKETQLRERIDDPVTSRPPEPALTNLSRLQLADRAPEDRPHPEGAPHPTDPVTKEPVKRGDT